MDTFDAINQRRSVKGYGPSHRLTAVDQAQVTDYEGKEQLQRGEAMRR